MPAPLWHLISTNFLKCCRILTFLVLFWTNLHYIWLKFSIIFGANLVLYIITQLALFLVQIRCRFNVHFCLEETWRLHFSWEELLIDCWLVDCYLAHNKHNFNLLLTQIVLLVQSAKILLVHPKCEIFFGTLSKCKKKSIFR